MFRTATTPTVSWQWRIMVTARVKSSLGTAWRLIGRNEVGYLNEPSVTGGNPISANGQTMFKDMLGSTLGISNGKNFSRTVMTSFGAYGDESSFYTGKPKVDGLGYTFNYRNYRADQGKWQTADPLGYPDGFNNYAYVNNGVTCYIDFMGGICNSFDFWARR